MNPDIFIELTFSVADDATMIRTNAKRDVVSELLENYLRAIIGAGEDPTPPIVRDIYKITLGVELADDSWGSNHDCGNKGLRDGIVMRICTLTSEGSSKVTYADQ